MSRRGRHGRHGHPGIPRPAEAHGGPAPERASGLVDARVVEARPVEARPVDARPPDARPLDPRPTEHHPLAPVEPVPTRSSPAPVPDAHALVPSTNGLDGPGQPATPVTMPPT